MKETALSLIGALVMLTTPLAGLAEGNTAYRKMKKGSHRAQEHHCKEGSAKCAGKKMKHRTQEAGDYMGDKAEEAKDKAD